MTQGAASVSRGAVSPDLLAKLRDIVGASHVLTGTDVSSRYPGFFMTQIGADAIVRPGSTEEISKILALCNTAGQPVIVHGGLSGWVRATQTQPGDLVVSLERMNKIEEIDTANRTATVQAGVVLQTLQEKLDSHGLIFALDLGGRGSCQVGGNAATNAGGVRVIRYGMMREQVLGLEAVLADGRVISSMNHMIKNNTGYDLKQLFIGSEGTLGVITRLVVRLREKPKSSNTAIACTGSFENVAKLLRHMDGALGGQLSAFEMIDNAFYGLNTSEGRHTPPLPRDKRFYIVIESLGANQEKDANFFEEALASASEAGLIDDAVLAQSDRERNGIWAIREDLEHVVREFKPFYAFDVSLPVGRMDAYMDAVKARVKAKWAGGAIAFLGHVGDGNLHIAIGAGGANDRHAVEACVYEPLEAINGSVSAEHGIGLEKKDWFSISRSVDERALMLTLKNTLDPRNILNPGKIFDTAAS